MNKKISDILSDNISSRYTNYPPDHNKLLIKRLRTDEDEYKRVYFNKLFDLTFKECLGYFIGKNSIEELEGMKSFESIKVTKFLILISLDIFASLDNSFIVDLFLFGEHV